MFDRKRKQIGAVAVTLAMVFTIGLILGTVALFYVPSEVTADAAAAFGLSERGAFGEQFKESLAFELVWMLTVWLLGSSVLTAPFTGAVMSLRGFVIGFSLSFVLMSELDRMKLFVCSILPQCMTALPLMSIFILDCVIYASEKKYKDNYRTGYFLHGMLFMLVTVPMSALEAWLMMIFGKFY